MGLGSHNSDKQGEVQQVRVSRYFEICVAVEQQIG